MERCIYEIEGMTCKSCVKSIEAQVSDLPAVVKVTVSLTSKQASIFYDAAQVQAADIQVIIEGLGFDVVILQAVSCSNELMEVWAKEEPPWFTTTKPVLPLQDVIISPKEGRSPVTTGSPSSSVEVIAITVPTEKHTAFKKTIFLVKGIFIWYRTVECVVIISLPLFYVFHYSINASITFIHYIIQIHNLVFIIYVIKFRL